MALKILLMYEQVGHCRIYGYYFIHRDVGADMVFQGSNTTDDGSVEYMRYRKADEDVKFSKDMYIYMCVNQDKRA